MANPVPLNTFLSKMQAIYNSHPAYGQPGDGSDGTCDCIGLIIGSIRRAGGSWTGIHGSNYAARWELEDAQEITSISQLYVGMAVFKYNIDNKDLSAKYKDPKNKYYNGDLRDYYHVGTVISVNPLKIMHMTSPTARIDKDLGKWRYGGRLKKVNYGIIPKPDDGGVDILVEKYKMKVNVSKGTTLNLRKEATSSSPVITRIPNGTTLSIFNDSSKFYQTEYKNQVGYVDSSFLVPVGDESGNKKVGILIPLPANLVDQVLEALHKSESVN